MKMKMKISSIAHSYKELKLKINRQTWVKYIAKVFNYKYKYFEKKTNTNTNTNTNTVYNIVFEI